MRANTITQQTAKPKAARPFFFRDPSWSGEPESDEDEDDGKEKKKPEEEVGKPMVIIDKASKRPMTERRHTLAGMVVEEGI